MRAGKFGRKFASTPAFRANAFGYNQGPFGQQQPNEQANGDSSLQPMIYAPHLQNPQPQGPVPSNTPAGVNTRMPMTGGPTEPPALEVVRMDATAVNNVTVTGEAASGNTCLAIRAVGKKLCSHTCSQLP